MSSGESAISKGLMDFILFLVRHIFFINLLQTLCLVDNRYLNRRPFYFKLYLFRLHAYHREELTLIDRTITVNC